MPRDIDRVQAELKRALPAIVIDQLQVSHPGDDDGLWFIAHPAALAELQIESSTGNAPFLIESNADDRRSTVESVEAAVQTIMERLGIRDGTV
jgi:hypothetical protein